MQEATSSRTTLLDGGWWPQSSDACAELPSLIAAMDSSRGPVTHVLLNAAEWDLPTRAGSPSRAELSAWAGTPPNRPVC
ncbi:DUF5994 family protein [Couchioplanes caeruleus]